MMGKGVTCPDDMFHCAASLSECSEFFQTYFTVSKSYFIHSKTHHLWAYFQNHNSQLNFSFKGTTTPISTTTAPSKLHLWLCVHWFYSFMNYNVMTVKLVGSVNNRRIFFIHEFCLQFQRKRFSIWES